MKGIIALDIDGTLTDLKHQIAGDTTKFLGDLHTDGWVIALVTGRTYSFSQMSIEHFHFPYYLAVQNGADIVLMPDKKHLIQHYIDQKTIEIVEEVYKEIDEDFLIYAGFELGDFCAYRHQNFSPKTLAYLEKLKKLTPFGWLDVNDFSDLPQKDFPMIKCFGKLDDMLKIKASLVNQPVSVCVIRDIIDPSMHLCIITASNANKGDAIMWIKDHLNISGPIIAAGDDNNDIPMLEKADVPIAVVTGPDTLKKHAKLISSPGHGKGIVKAIQHAITLC